jgi:broad specificity phosphatase PhoE
LVTTHGGVIQAILRWILAVSSVHPLALAINNGSLHCLSSGPTGWRILETGRMAPTPSP